MALLDVNKPETWTEQKIFDFVCIKLAEQGKRSISVMGCAYRGPGGLKCAVGHLIPDSLYESGMDGVDEGSMGVDALTDRFKSLSFLGPFTPLLQKLQNAHDLAHNVENLRDRLKLLAEQRGLKKALACTIMKWER